MVAPHQLIHPNKGVKHCLACVDRASIRHMRPFFDDVIYYLTPKVSAFGTHLRYFTPASDRVPVLASAQSDS